MAVAVGFIGLGNMGRPMALNLVKRGFSLVVHDVDQVRVGPLRERGATVAASAEDVAAATGRTIVMAGLNKEDGSAIVKVLERMAGVHVGDPDAPGGGA